MSIEKSAIKMELEETLQECTKECKKYCKEYIKKYLNIKYGEPRWLTYSPKSASEVHPDDLHKYHTNVLKKLTYCSENIICVTEFKNERMHFHIFLDVKDKIKYNIFVNTLMTNSMARSYKGEPKGGIHYLFKDVEDALEILTLDKIIQTETQLKKVIEDDKLERQIERKQIKQIREQMKLAQRLEEYKSIPKWMQEDYSEEEE